MALEQTRDLGGNLLRLLLTNPSRYRPVVAFLDGVTQNLSQLTWTDCERIGAEIALANDSQFCAGIRGGMTTALRDEVGAAAEKLAPVIALALQVNRGQGALTHAQLVAVREAGWSDATIEDVVGLVASLRVFSTLATTLGFGQMPAAAFAEIGAGTVAAGGYTVAYDAYLQGAEGKPG